MHSAASPAETPAETPTQLDFAWPLFKAFPSKFKTQRSLFDTKCSYQIPQDCIVEQTKTQYTC